MTYKSEIAVSILDNHDPQTYTYTCGIHTFQIVSVAKYLSEILIVTCDQCTKQMIPQTS